MKLQEARDSLPQQGNCNYYTYEHIADGKVFYVGEGTGDRCKSTDRNNSWKLVAKKAKVLEYRIVAWRDNKKDAESMERQVWLNNVNAGNILVNAKEPKNFVVTKIVKEIVDREISVPTDTVLVPLQIANLLKKLISERDHARERYLLAKDKISRLENEIEGYYDVMADRLSDPKYGVELNKSTITDITDQEPAMRDDAPFDNLPF